MFSGLLIATSNAASVAELQQKLAQASRTAANLQEELNSMNAVIDALNAQIADTNKRIAILQPKIDATQADLDAKKATLAAHIRADYSLSHSTTLEILVGSDNLSDFINRKQYIENAEHKVNELVQQVLAVKKQLDSEKASLESLSADLATQKANADAQVAIKNNLLAQTKGDQAKYQEMIAAAQAASAGFGSTLRGAAGSYGHVDAGQVIGHEGSTGNSTGAHLHFSVYLNRSPQNPGGYVNSGQMRWPLDNYFTTQGFGCTSLVFEVVNTSCPGGHYHDGIDMASNFGDPIHAVAAGTIIMNGFQANGFGHYIVIDHGDGLWSLYGHMQ